MIWLSFFAGTGLSFFVLILVAIILPEKKNKELIAKTDAFHDEFMLHWEKAGILSAARNEALNRLADDIASLLAMQPEVK